MKIPQLTKREKLLLLLSVVLWSCIGVAAVKMIRPDGVQIDASTSIDHFTIIGLLQECSWSDLVFYEEEIHGSIIIYADGNSISETMDQQILEGFEIAEGGYKGASEVQRDSKARNLMPHCLDG